MTGFDRLEFGNVVRNIHSNILQLLDRNGNKDALVHLDVYHSEIPDTRQEKIAHDLMDKDGSLRVVIATSALSMGFDAAGNYYTWAIWLRVPVTNLKEGSLSQCNFT